MKTVSLKDTTKESYEIFSIIFNRLVVPPYEEGLADWRNAILLVKPADLYYIGSTIPDLKMQLRWIYNYSIDDPFVCIFLAHCYVVGYIAGIKQYLGHAEDFTLRAIRGFYIGLNDYGEFNVYNEAIAHWYLGKLYSSFDESKNYRIEFVKAFDLLSGIKNGYRGIRPFDKFYIQLYTWLNELEPQYRRPGPKKH